jgi:hypothetical protein
MDILQNEYVALGSFVIFIIGLIMILQKDTPTSSKKGVRGVGLVFIIVSSSLAAYRLLQFSGISISGGSRCVDKYSDPNCTVKKINYSTFEKFLAVIGLDIIAQSWAKARFIRMGSDFMPTGY